MKKGVEHPQSVSLLAGVRLPHKLFRDCSEDGSLFIILKISLQNIAVESWKCYNVEISANKDEILGIAAKMESALQEV